MTAVDFLIPYYKAVLIRAGAPTKSGVLIWNRVLGTKGVPGVMKTDECLFTKQLTQGKRLITKKRLLEYTVLFAITIASKGKYKLPLLQLLPGARRTDIQVSLHAIKI